MKLELFKNKKEFNDWLSIAVYSNYSEDTPAEEIIVDAEFRDEMLASLKYTKVLKSNFKISFGLPILLVLRDDNNKIIGTASVRRDEHKAYAAQVNNVAIAPECRRRGFGKYMIDQIAELVKDHSNYYHITLTTDASKGFYVHIGMQLVGILDFGKHKRYYFAKEL